MSSFAQALWQFVPGQMLAAPSGPPANDDSFPPAYFYTQPGATGPGFYDNMSPQSWQEGSAVTGDLYDPHQQTFDQPAAPNHNPSAANHSHSLHPTAASSTPAPSSPPPREFCCKQPPRGGNAVAQRRMLWQM